MHMNHTCFKTNISDNITIKQFFKRHYYPNNECLKSIVFCPLVFCSLKDYTYELYIIYKPRHQTSLQNKIVKKDIIICTISLLMEAIGIQSDGLVPIERLFIRVIESHISQKPGHQPMLQKIVFKIYYYPNNQSVQWDLYY